MMKVDRGEQLFEQRLGSIGTQSVNIKMNQRIPTHLEALIQLVYCVGAVVPEASERMRGACGPESEKIGSPPSS